MPDPSKYLRRYPPTRTDSSFQSPCEESTMFSMFPYSRRLTKILSLSVDSHPRPLLKSMENKYTRLQIYWILEGGVGKCITSYDGKVTDPKTTLGNPWKHFPERKNSLRTSIQLTCTNLVQLKVFFCFVYTCTCYGTRFATCE